MRPELYLYVTITATLWDSSRNKPKQVQITHMQQKGATRETEKVLQGPSLLRQGKPAGFLGGRLHIPTYRCCQDFMKSFLFTCSSGSDSSASLQKPPFGATLL